MDGDYHINQLESKEIFVSKLQSKFPNIVLVDEYKSIRTPIKFYCKIHNYIFSAKPLNILRSSSGCKLCSAQHRSQTSRISNDIFIERLSQISANIVPLQKYSNSKERIYVRCSICNNKWLAMPSDLLSGRSKCQKCSMKALNVSRRLSREQFIQNVHQRNVCSDTFDVLGDYSGTRNYILCRCKVCGEEWTPYANSLLNDNVSCPVCKLSKGEMRIKQWLDNKKITYCMQKSFIGLVGLNNGLLRFDFYLPDYNVLIEYQGQYHDGSVANQTDEQYSYQLEHDRRKKKFAKENNIELLEIWYKDFDNIEKLLQQHLMGKI